MTTTSQAGGAAVLLLSLAWLTAVLLRWQGVDSAEPLVAIALQGAWTALFSLASLGAGSVPWRVCRGGLTRPTDWLIAAGLGCAVLVTAALGLSVLGLFRPWALALVLLVAALAGAAALWRHRGEIRRLQVNPKLLPFVVLIALVGAGTFLMTATASPFYDQYHYHLGFPYQWLRLGRLEIFPRHAYSYFPAAMGTLFAYPLTVLGTWSAQAIHWWSGALAVLATAALAGGLGGPRAAMVAAAIVAATPSVMQVSTWAAADLGATAFGALAWLVVARNWQAGAPPAGSGVWLAVGALAGIAAAAKILALTTVVVPVLAVSLLAPPRRTGALVRRGALLGLGVVLTLGPWAARSFAASGDPFYPFGSSYLARLTRSGEAVEGVVASKIVAGEAGARSPGLLATLATFQPTGDAGAIGPLYLGLLPLAFWSVLRDRRRGAVFVALGALLAVAGWGVGPPRGRYLLPALPLLAALAAAGWRHALAAAPRGARRWLGALLLLALGWSALGGATPLEMRRLACTLGADDQEELMRRYVTYWPAIRPVDTQLPASARLLLVGESRPYLLNRDLVVEDPFQKPLLVELAETAQQPGDIAAALAQQGVTHLLVNHQEARRIAAMNGRASYLETRDEAAAGRLVAFMATCLKSVITAPPVEVWALEPCPW